MFEYYKHLPKEDQPYSEFDRINSEVWSTLILFFIQPVITLCTFVYYLLKQD